MCLKVCNQICSFGNVLYKISQHALRCIFFPFEISTSRVSLTYRREFIVFGSAQINIVFYLRAAPIFLFFICSSSLSLSLYVVFYSSVCLHNLFGIPSGLPPAVLRCLQFRFLCFRFALSSCSCCFASLCADIFVYFQRLRLFSVSVDTKHIYKCICIELYKPRIPVAVTVVLILVARLSVSALFV